MPSEPVVLTLGAESVTCAVLCAALTVAWATFGHPRHARSWAWAYGIGAMQALVNAVAIAVGGSTAVMGVAFLLAALSGPPLAIGVRRRARLPSRRRLFAAATAVEILLVALCLTTPALRPIGFGIATLFAAGCTGLAACTAYRPGVTPLADRIFVVALGVLACVEAAGGVLAALSAEPGCGWLYAAQSTAFALGILPATAFAGVATVLLLGSDLAAELGRLAARDPLTGLFNRRGFQEGAVRSLANTRRGRMRATLAVVDIDHFKAINDRFGHTAGDRALGYVAARLTAGVRQGDLVARMGGEEFALLLVDADGDSGYTAVDRIRAAIGEGFDHDGAHVPVTASFGLAEVALGPGDIEAIIAATLAAADRALYLSKLDGRDRVTIAEPAA